MMIRARSVRAAALLAVGGTVVLVFTGRELRPTLAGLLLVQLSNLAFAFGPGVYKACGANGRCHSFEVK